ncbi:MAG: tRNA (N(6)-L-threonylcarbamoyladenosine(37)-C(2))-methylthiotransferase MtaB [Firmicutes bacterium]|nr:tRNA (N(6)-L-threonylcarbamoyladenosine(37)-C(2))-methylthiotransferase MtaB [Bacillota bacterium]
MKFYIETFGCKVNTYESSFIKQSLLANGFLFVNDMKAADIIVINTCTVTNTADSKCKKYVRRVRRENKDSILVVIGCSVQNNFEEYNNMNIDILLGNRHKSKIVELINNYICNHKRYSYIDNNRDLTFENMEITNFDHTRAFIKVQDGCDNFCSYCIIPFMRGKCRSKEFDSIVKEAIKLVSNGHKEIVLTGIHTGSYNDNGKDLVDLIEELSKLEFLERIRLSSVEITELNDKFMNMLKHNYKFCDHLHIPLQAGSDEVLKMMNRKYDLEYFFNKVSEIKNIRPNISITTDIIVGFPEETNEMFEKTYETARKIGFSKIHVFPYSKRNGTAASKMKEVSAQEKTNRVHKLLELSDLLEREYNNRFNNQEVEVLIEEVKNGKSIGHTSNFLKVEISDILEKNQIYKTIYKIK